MVRVALISTWSFTSRPAFVGSAESQRLRSFSLWVRLILVLFGLLLSVISEDASLCGCVLGCGCEMVLLLELATMSACLLAKV